MKTRTSTIRISTAVALGALLLVGACGGEDDNAGFSTTKAADSTSSPKPDDSEQPAESDGAISLQQNVTQGQNPPIWQFPVNVEGWSIHVVDQNGINQLTKDESVFTSSQLAQGTSGGDDEGNSRAYLETYATGMRDLDGVESFTGQEPTTTTNPSDQGDLEFLSQDVKYVTVSGRTYTSRLLVRSLDTNALVLQYAAPEADWSEEEWQKLTANVRAQLGT